jgi:hypothetical protein
MVREGRVSSVLDKSVYEALVQPQPKERDSRLRNLALMGARSVQTGRLDAYIRLHIKKPSTPRMERFLNNGTVRVRRWYEPVAGWLLQADSVAGEIVLVIDGPKVSTHHAWCWSVTPVVSG